MTSAPESGQKGGKILQNALSYAAVAVIFLAIVAYPAIRKFGHNPGSYWFKKGLQYDLGKGVTQDYVEARMQVTPKR
jgi:hypothetical protein